MTLNFGLDTDSWLLVSRTGREYTSASVRQWVGGILWQQPLGKYHTQVQGMTSYFIDKEPAQQWGWPAREALAMTRGMVSLSVACPSGSHWRLGPSTLNSEGYASRAISLLLCRLWSQHTSDFSRCLSELIQSSLLHVLDIQVWDSSTDLLYFSLYPSTTPSVQPFIYPSVSAPVCWSILHLPPLF